MVHVFDVSQNEGSPLPDGHAPKLLEGEGPPGAWDKLADLVKRKGFAIHFSPLGNVNGETRCSSHQVHINEVIPADAQLKTLVRELAHVRAGHGSRPGLTRELAECEAKGPATISGTPTSADSASLTLTAALTISIVP